MTISLCMIVRNEAESLARCLESAKGVADEIILVDTGSTDGTIDIAKRYTQKVYEFAWVDDFAAARNFAFSKATRQYCMWLDADDVLESGDREALLRLKALLPEEVDVVMMRYHTAFDEKGQPTFSYYRERIMRNSQQYRWEGRVHEAVTPAGNVVYSEIAVSHRKVKEADSGRNLCIYEMQKKAGETFSPRDQFYYGRELYYHASYDAALSILHEFLVEGQGWLENKIEACRTMALCHRANGEAQKARLALLHSFEYDAPRAEVCCDLGELFLAEEKYEQAIFWYQLALTKQRNDTSGAFVSPDCYGYLPYIQLCVCYDRMGQKKKAREYNEKAGKLRPDSPAYQYNKAYYEELFAEHKELSQ